METIKEHRRPGNASTAETAIDRYLMEFRRLVDDLDRAAILNVVDVLRAARAQARTVYIAGNGGSAATAAHFANDLGKATRAAGGFRVMCLSDNVSWLTALANDEGFERVFTGQLENFASPEDVLIVISASGSSPNILEAVEFARKHGMLSVGLVGFDGGRVKDLVDRAVWVETENGAYGVVETTHALVCDLITTCLAEE